MAITFDGSLVSEKVGGRRDVTLFVTVVCLTIKKTGCLGVNVSFVLWVVATQRFLEFSPRKLGKMNPF